MTSSSSPAASVAQPGPATFVVLCLVACLYRPGAAEWAYLPLEILIRSLARGMFRVFGQWHGAHFPLPEKVRPRPCRMSFPNRSSKKLTFSVESSVCLSFSHL